MALPEEKEHCGRDERASTVGTRDMTRCLLVLCYFTSFCYPAAYYKNGVDVIIPCTVISGPNNGTRTWFLRECCLKTSSPGGQGWRTGASRYLQTTEATPYLKSACGTLAYCWSAQTGRAIGTLWSAPAAWLRASRSATSRRAHSVKCDCFQTQN